MPTPLEAVVNGAEYGLRIGPLAPTATPPDIIENKPSLYQPPPSPFHDPTNL